jgi:hypothetical protein
LAHGANERIRQFTWQQSAALLEELIIGAVHRKSPDLRLTSIAEPAMSAPLQVEGD